MESLFINKRHIRSLWQLKKLTAFLFLLCSQVIAAQLADFTLQVTPTPETCTANGSLSFTVTNTVPGASMIYTIFHLPNVTTPIAAVTMTSYTGLVAGDYRVVATQSLGSATFSQYQDVTIDNNLVLLVYSLTATPEVCGNDGQIVFNVTNGTAVSYEIFSGPVTRPLQPSNIFPNLPSGTYLVRAFDVCGEGLARSFVVGNANPNINIFPGSAVINSCNTFLLTASLTSGPNNIIAFPIDATVTIYPPVGAPIVYNHTGLFNSPVQSIPAYYSGYSYSITVTDRCGTVYTRNNIPISVVPNPQIQLNLGAVGCTGVKLLITTSGGMVNPVTVSFPSAPAGFNPITYNPNHPGPFTTGSAAPIAYFNSTTPFPSGVYVVAVTDACGTTATSTISITNSPNPPANVLVDSRPSCQIGFGSVKIYGNLLNSIQMLSAPASYNVTMPHDFTTDMSAGGVLYLGPLPDGDYVFQTVDQCGATRITNTHVTGYTSGATTGIITENCNTFNFQLQHTTNILANYFLQKLNPVTNEWEHPITGAVGIPPTVDSGNALEIFNNTAINNLQFTGNFRVIKRFNTYETGMMVSAPCYELLYSFEFTGLPGITGVYSFACQNNAYDTVVVASGYEPLIYRIIAKNGLPFVIDNGYSDIFLALQPAIYTFQIEDGCGNVSNSVFDISIPTILPVTATAFCSGQNATLSVPTFPFLQYQWWEEANPTTILSSSSQLQFAPFNPVTDNGTYHVHIYYDNPNSCIDYVYDYQIYVDPHVPDAGQGQTIQYCTNPGTVDLFSLLSGNYDTNGIWQEITGSGTLMNNFWNAAAVGYGTFQFTYTVMGLCGVYDQSTIIIQLNATPETPVAFLDESEVICASQALHLYATAIPFGSYQWSGPNGFSSTVQNPVISNASIANNGTYTVQAYSQGCESAISSVEVLVNPQPIFTVSSDCINNQYTITAAVDDSIDLETVSYLWTGPNNFTSTGNPIVITQMAAGIYTVTVTSPLGCPRTSEIDISQTMCTIPAGISPNNDGKNDVFDLSGFDVTKLEIFNRFGTLVYEKTNYTDEWHGQDSNDNELPDATYYYFVRMASGAVETGWVYLSK